MTEATTDATTGTTTKTTTTVEVVETKAAGGAEPEPETRLVHLNTTGEIALPSRRYPAPVEEQADTTDTTTRKSEVH
jgi:hypothetical protein